MCSIIGRLAMGIIGFGWLEVSGRSLVPSPPAMITAFTTRPPAVAGPPAAKQRTAGHRDVGAGGQPGQDKSDDAGHPGEDVDRVLPGGVAVTEEEGRVGEHEGERARLAHPEDVDPGGSERRQQQDGHRHHHLAGEGGHSEPHWDGAVHGDGDDGGHHQHTVGDRIEHLTDGRHLVVAAGDEPVHPVGGAERAQQHRGCSLSTRAEQQPEEQWYAGQPHHCDPVGYGETTRPRSSCAGGPAATGAARSSPPIAISPALFTEPSLRARVGPG